MKEQNELLIKLIALRVEWLIRGEYQEDSFSHAKTDCAIQLGELLKKYVSSEMYTQIAEPLALQERQDWESRGYKKTENAKRLERFREEYDRLYEKNASSK